MYTLTLTLLVCWHMHHGGVANEHTWTLCTNSMRNQCMFLQVFILGSGAATTQNTCFSIVITWNWVRNRPSPPDRSIEHVNRHPEGQATVCRSETNDREQLLKSRVHESICGSCVATTQNTYFSTAHTCNWVRNRPAPPDRSTGHVSRHLEGQATVCRSETNDREQLLKFRVHESICGSCAATTQNTHFSTARTCNWVRNRPAPPDRSIGHVSRRLEGQATVSRSETNDREQSLKSRTTWVHFGVLCRNPPKH